LQGLEFDHSNQYIRELESRLKCDEGNNLEVFKQAANYIVSPDLEVPISSGIESVDIFIERLRKSYEDLEQNENLSMNSQNCQAAFRQ